MKIHLGLDFLVADGNHVRCFQLLNAAGRAEAIADFENQSLVRYLHTDRFKRQAHAFVKTCNDIVLGVTTFVPSYSKWRHGGWYVHNVRYPSGAIGCVSCNYDDGKWRIVCHPEAFEKQPTFKNRDDAARAEYVMVALMKANGKGKES